MMTSQFTSALLTGEVFGAVRVCFPALGKRPFTAFYESENITCIAGSGDSAMALKFHRPGYHTKAEIEYTAGWMTYIGENTAIRVQKPIPGRDGAYGQVIPLPGGGSCICSLSSFIPGATLEGCSDKEAPGWYEKAGALTAQMHKTVQGFIPAARGQNSGTCKKHPPPSCFVWDTDTLIGRHALFGDWREDPAISAAQKSVLETACTKIALRLEAYGKQNDTYGLIHHDLRFSNFVAVDGDIAVIDFDDMGLGWFLNDFGAAFSFVETHRDIKSFVAAWLKGYLSIRPLRERDLHELETFLLIRRLMLQGWIFTHPSSAPVKAGLGQAFLQGTLALANAFIRSP